MAGISIAIGADTREAAKSAENLATSLGQLSDTLEVIQKDGQGAGEAVEQGMRGAQQATAQAGLAAEQAASKWSDFKPAVLQSDEALQQLGRDAETAGRATQEAVSGTGVAARKAGQETEEGSKIGEAALMNLAYSSGSVGEAFTGPAGLMSQVGMFAAYLGPALGPIAGSAVTLAGIGLAALGQIAGSTSTEAAQLTQEIKDLTNELLGSQSGADAFDEGLRKWAKDASDFGGKALTDVAGDAKTAGVSFFDVGTAITSHSIPAMQQQVKHLDELRSGYRAAAAAAADANDPEGAAADRAKIAAIGSLTGVLKTNIAAQKQAQEATEVAAKSLGLTVPQYQKYESAVAAAQKASDSFTTNLDGSITSAGQNLSSFVKNGVIDLNKWEASIIAAAKGAADTVLDINAAMGRGMTTAGQQYAESLGPAFGQAYDQAKKEGSAAVSKLVKTMNEAGAASGVAYGDELRDKMPKTVKGPTVKVGVDRGAYDALVREINGKTYTAYVDFVPRGGNRVI